MGVGEALQGGSSGRREAVGDLLNTVGSRVSPSISPPPTPSFCPCVLQAALGKRHRTMHKPAIGGGRCTSRSIDGRPMDRTERRKLGEARTIEDQLEVGPPMYPHSGAGRSSLPNLANKERPPENERRRCILKPEAADATDQPRPASVGRDGSAEWAG